MTRPMLHFWQPVLTDHAIFTFKALADELGMEALCISDRAELGIRKDQGWTSASDVLPMELLPADGWQARIDGLIGRHSDDIHIIASPFERSRINLALRLATRQRTQVFLSSEPYAPGAVSYFGSGVTLKDRIKGWVRPWLYRSYGLRYAKRLSGVFAISPLAVQQYTRMGVAQHRVFPFGYFVPAAHSITASVPRPEARKGLRIAFVGSLIARKGVTIAIEALKRMSLSATLDIFGPGDPAALGPLPSNARYGGKIAFGQTQAALVPYDVLVVPSMHDGWAVVVNEGIQAGVAVVASEETGASAMIARWQCGARFPAGNVDALASQLDRLASNDRLLEEARMQARTLARLLDPAEAGRYMAGCIRATQASEAPPPCPWY